MFRRWKRERFGSRKRLFGGAHGSAAAGRGAIVLQARGPKTPHPVTIDRALPGEELLDRQRIAGTGFFQADQAGAHASDHLRLAADDPAPGARGRQVFEAQAAPVDAENHHASVAVELGAHRLLPRYNPMSSEPMPYDLRNR